MRITAGRTPRAIATRAAAVVALTLVMAVLAAVPAAQRPVAAQESQTVDSAVQRLLALPYQPSYVPTGTDAAFDGDDYPAAFALTDTTTGTCCTGPVPDQPPLADLAPPFAAFPGSFELIELTSYDGTPLHAFVSMTEGAPGVVVAHGFNTNGKHSAVRYGAMLASNGYSVIVPDHRDMGREWERGGSWHPDGTRHGQSLGWKESEDFLVAAEELHRRGAPAVGMLGFSEGAQNTILTLSKDYDGIIDAAMTFSPPADQATLAQRNDASTRALLTTVVNNPDLCGYLAEVGAREEFSASPNFMLRHDSAVDALDGIIGAGVDVPAVHFFAQDDELVPDWNAVALASRTLDMPTQRTVLIEAGNHAYFYDRWWTQAAVLDWFGGWLDPGGSATTAQATVAQTPGGAPLAEQTVDLAGTTRDEGDAELRTRAPCPDADEPIGPTALLSASGDGAERVLDGRRSYSGWDDHEVVSWELASDTAGLAASGDELAAARVGHVFPAGIHEVVLTVTDDTGRQATASATVEVAAAGDGTGASGGAAGASGSGDTPATTLPATGGGLTLLGLAGMLALLAPRTTTWKGGPGR